MPLSELSVNELKQWLREHLQAKGDALEALEGPAGTLPFETPLREWKDADPDLRGRIAEATVDLIKEVPNQGWTPEVLRWLIDFVERAAVPEAKQTLEAAAYTGKWLSEGPAAHALCLRALRSLGWKGEPNFWRGQRDSVRMAYPALIFGGLLDNGHESAFRHLGELALDEDCAKAICHLLASLVAMEGAEKVWSWIRDAQPTLDPTVFKVFEDWFRVRGYDIGPLTKETWAHESTNGAKLEEILQREAA